MLVGAGQLGSRHLQGLIYSNFKLSINVVDSSSESLTNSRERWAGAGGEASPHHVRWLTELPSDLPEIDVAIIATSSKGRADIVCALSELSTVRFWVLEKVLTQASIELEVLQSATLRSQGAWVNIPRRMMAGYQSLKRILPGQDPFSASFSGGLWGLACNCIHFIDLVSWLSGESLIGVDINGLNDNWYESKRPGYFETTGELVAHFEGGTNLRLNSEMGEDMKPIRVVLNNGVLWEIDESKGIFRSSDGLQFDGRIEPQSQLSGRLVDSILNRGRCDLPTLVESSATHKIIVDAMLIHWNRSQNRNDELVPIT